MRGCEDGGFVKKMIIKGLHLGEVGVDLGVASGHEGMPWVEAGRFSLRERLKEGTRAHGSGRLFLPGGERRFGLAGRVACIPRVWRSVSHLMADVGAKLPGLIILVCTGVFENGEETGSCGGSGGMWVGSSVAGDGGHADL
jgi:hypothetical protein